MATLVLNKDSLSVKLESNHLVIHEHADCDSFRRVSLANVERVIVAGQPAITFPVLAKFMDLGIPCSFLTHGGRWRGMMDGDSGFHAQRRIRQYKCVGDPARALQMIRDVIAAKLTNARRTIQRLSAERGVCLANVPAWMALSALKSEVAFLDTAKSLRGLEGMAANEYFSLLARFFPPDVPFVRRSRRPPRDEANALLSFVYTLLANIFTSAIRAHGLDASAGFFHCGFDRSPALALDLMDSFRPAWADRLVLDLLNHRRIRTAEHFRRLDAGGVYLNEEGRKIVFMAFDEMLERRRKTEKGEMSRRNIIGDTVCRFVRMVEGHGSMEFFTVA